MNRQKDRKIERQKDGKGKRRKDGKTERRKDWLPRDDLCSPSEPAHSMKVKTDRQK